MSLVYIFRGLLTGASSPEDLQGSYLGRSVVRQSSWSIHAAEEVAIASLGHDSAGTEPWNRVH